MKLAGHSNITTTQRYVHPEADAMSRAAQAEWDLRKGKKPEQKPEQLIKPQELCVQVIDNKGRKWRNWQTHQT